MPSNEEALSPQAQEQQKANFNDWIARTEQKLAADPRAQPWKQTFGGKANCSSGQVDWIHVRKEEDVQHNN